MRESPSRSIGREEYAPRKAASAYGGVGKQNANIPNRTRWAREGVGAGIRGGGSEAISHILSDLAHVIFLLRAMVAKVYI